MKFPKWLRVEVVAAVVLVCFASLLVLYNLGQSSLKPWDEAWYGAIAREVLRGGFQGNPLLLNFNGAIFVDHPPLGFYLKALSMAVFGATSFGVRLPEALAGVAAVVIAFLIGRRSSSSWAGFWAGLMLLTSRWFLFRARSGNLDVLLLLSQLMVLYTMLEVVLAEVGEKSKNWWHMHRWYLGMWLALGVSLSVKSLISLQLLPLVGFVALVYLRRQRVNIFSSEGQALIWVGLAGLIGPIVPWVAMNYWYDPVLFVKKQASIGLRSDSAKTVNFDVMRLTLSYLQAAMHKWFKIVGLASVVGAALFVLTKDKKRLTFGVLLAYVGLVAFPYFISVKTEIWHLVPLVGALVVLGAVALDEGVMFGVKFLAKRLRERVRLFTSVILTAGLMAIAAISVRDYWNEFLSIREYPTDYLKIARHVSSRDVVLYTTTDAYFPGLVMYADMRAPGRLQYISDTEFLPFCADHAKVHAGDGTPFQTVARFGDWMMNATSDRFVKAREGDLVLIELSPEECFQLVNE